MTLDLEAIQARAKAIADQLEELDDACKPFKPWMQDTCRLTDDMKAMIAEIRRRLLAEERRRCHLAGHKTQPLRLVANVPRPAP